MTWKRLNDMIMILSNYFLVKIFFYLIFFCLIKRMSKIFDGKEFKEYKTKRNVVYIARDGSILDKDLKDG